MTVNMGKKSDYFNTKHINLNEYVPEYLKSRILDGIIDNTFNRFLTNPEYSYYNGYIGESDNSSTLSQISERTEFRQKNQLQPIVTVDLGNTKKNMTFQDFMRRLDRTGVDIDSFDGWGRSQQFNWVPPIDIDKLINYKNYYWTGDHSDIHYVTIKNRKTASQATYKELLSSHYSISEQYYETNDTQIASTVGDGAIIIRTENNTYHLAVIESGTVNLLDGTQLSNVNIEGYVVLTHNIIGITNPNSAARLVLGGEWVNSATEGSIVLVANPSTDKVKYIRVVESEYDEDDDQTIITFDEPITQYENPTVLTFAPEIFLEHYRNEYVANNNRKYESHRWYNTGQIFYYDVVEKIHSMGVTAIDSTFDVGSTEVIDYTIDVDDFTSPLSSQKDYVLEVITGCNIGTYDVISYNTTTISGNFASVIDTTGEFFTDTNVDYKIYEKSTKDDWEVYTTRPTVFSIHYDNTTDIISTFNGMEYVDKVYGVSVGLQLVEYPMTMEESDWERHNCWVHRNQVENMSEAIRAQLPIIEYSNKIYLSNTTTAEYRWKYSPEPGVEYREVNTPPTLFELQNIIIEDGTEITYISNNTIILHPKYGNLVPHIQIGDIIHFSDFSVNSGYYPVINVEYKLQPLGEGYTEITLGTNVQSTADVAIGGKITPIKTSMGDDFLNSYVHWKFAGVKSITPSSITPEKNPMLDVSLFGEIVNTSFGQTYQTIVGPVWQEFSSLTGQYPGAVLPLHETLNKICLYEDYQEGDLRVYLNGVRQYGNFEELSKLDLNEPLAVDDNELYVAGIKFYDNIIITPDDRIRIELGEAFLKDIGKRDAVVHVGDTIEYQTELYNLVSTRLIEQRLLDSNQYPLFKLYETDGNESNTSNEIFRFKTNYEYPLNKDILLRLETNRDREDIIFENLLLRDDESMLCYMENDTLQSIWRKGIKNEIHIPKLLASGEWDIPNSWYFNLTHENSKNISFRELYRHFSTIISSQNNPTFIRSDGGNIYHALRTPNLGVGGTIKEHNDSLDLLVSMTLLDHATVPKVVEFAKNAYVNQLDEVSKYLIRNVPLWNNPTSVEDLGINYIETNTVFDQLYGDSTTYTNGIGLRSFVASMATLGIIAPQTPLKIQSDGKTYIKHHDGHVSEISFNPNELLTYLGSNIKLKQISNSGDIFPDATQYEDGDIYCRIIKDSGLVEIYVLSNANWNEIDIIDSISNAILEIERKLFESSVIAAVKPYRLSELSNNPKFFHLLKIAFEKYSHLNEVDPYANTNYDPNDPWTWNYSNTQISVDPLNQTTLDLGVASWQGIYYKLYGTPYISDEPWILQGYGIKPAWWDNEYKNVDPTSTRKWNSIMWNNILSGIVPVGNILPNGEVSTESIGEVTEYYYVPVNTTNVDTLDGIRPDDMIPPVWDSSNDSTGTGIRSIYEKGVDHIITPNSRSVFGDLGTIEWEWRSSIHFVYEMLIIAYKLDPQKLLHRIIGRSYVNVGCLQVDGTLGRVPRHYDIVPHGYVHGEGIYINDGYLQWFSHFNRYHGYDVGMVDYHKLLSGWDVKLAYQLDNVINTETLNVRGESVEIDEIDYEVSLSKTEGIDDFEFKSLKVDVLRIAPKLLHDDNRSGKWITRVTPLDPTNNNEIDLYHMENYPFMWNSVGEFSTFKYEILDVGIVPPRNATILDYSTHLNINTQITGYTQNTVYQTNITTSSGNVTISENSDNINTVGDLIDVMNVELFTIDAHARLEGGSIVLYGDAISIVDSGLLSDILTVGGSYVISNITTPYEFMGYFDLPIGAERYLSMGDTFNIIDSTDYDGQYTITQVVLDVYGKKIRVFVDSILTPTTGSYDGYVVPSSALTLPWETGQEVWLTSTGKLPHPLSRDRSYYVIVVDDYTFKLADTKDNAIDGIELSINSTGTGIHHIGRLRYTFNPLSSTESAWNLYYPDTRQVVKLRGPTSISSIQSLCDVVFGYDEYLSSIGIVNENIDGLNVDIDTRRGNSWQVELEKFVEWLTTLDSLREITTIQWTGQIRSSNSTFFADVQAVPWKTGDPISITEHSDILPIELSDSISELYPYYVIRMYDGSMRIAATKSAAINGDHIQFTGGTGTITFKTFRRYKNVPSRILNPFKKQVTINHELGLLSNTFAKEQNDILTMQMVYDDLLNPMNLKDLLFFRNDAASVVESSDPDAKSIYGGHIYLDGMEHLIIFNNYNSSGGLIYDPFLGINTPRVFAEFVKSVDYTQRPTISGLALLDDEFYINIEHAISNIRYYYDTYSVFEKASTTDQVRKSVGYEGRVDYMDSIGVGSKSQFIFWQGYIHSKGTTKSIDVFGQHHLMGGMGVDEFWAYKMCSFGSSKKKIYPELKLFPEDVIKHELRLEFTPPTGGTVGLNYQNIRLTDQHRWNNHPDVTQMMYPDDSYYINATTEVILTNAENKFIYPILPEYNSPYISLGMHVDAVEVYYTNDVGDRVEALEEIDYEIVSSGILKFRHYATTWTDITIARVSYDYESENPATLIHKSELDTVLYDIPIWNPAIGHHAPLGYTGVNVESDLDPARYNTGVEETEVFWGRSEVGMVWLDSKYLNYIPYYDKKVFPDISDRSVNWGKLSDFGEIKLYRWIESDIPPEEYESVVNIDDTKIEPMSDRHTGNVRRVGYIKNVSGDYIEDSVLVSTMNIVEYDVFGDDPHMWKFVQFRMDSGLPSLPLEVYVNGHFIKTLNFSSTIALLVELYNIPEINSSSHITLVKRELTPTQEQLDNGDYIYQIPHTKIPHFDTIKRETTYKYYYWVESDKSTNVDSGTDLTIFDTSMELESISTPYMIIDGFRKSDNGYGVLFGYTYDPDESDLPSRYTQCIIKGLKGTVKSNDSYVLRFRKDQTLRDRISESGLDLHNVHEEWKLFRRNQQFKIDFELWLRLIESAIGYRVSKDGHIDYNYTLPSMDRITYDQLFRKSTRIGLSGDKVLADRDSILNLLEEIFSDTRDPITSVDDPLQFYTSYILESPEDVTKMLLEIYESFDFVDVNRIFFEVLNLSMMQNPEHPDFIKTSWVSIDVDASAGRLPINVLTIPETFESDYCFLNLPEFEDISEPLTFEDINIGINSGHVNQYWIGIL